MKNLPVALSLLLSFLYVQNAICQPKLSNKEIARRYIEEAVNKQKLDLLGEIFSDSFLAHNLLEDREGYNTISKLGEHISYLFKAFPDLHYTVGDIIEEGDKVAMRVVLTGTHKGEFMGYEASGNRIDYLSEIFFLRFEGGKIVESWYQFDLYNLFRILKGEKE